MEKYNDRGTAALGAESAAYAPRDVAQTAEAVGLNAIGQRLAEAIKQMEVFVSQIEDVEIRLNGNRPQKAEGTGTPPRPVPNGQIDLLQMGHDELQSRITRAFHALNGLQRSI